MAVSQLDTAWIAGAGMFVASGPWLAHVRPDSETPRLETAKGCHKVIDLAGRRRLTGFEVALNA
jgi:hypothetical protein